MFEREKIEIRILRNYLLSSEFRVINSTKSSEVLFVPPPPSGSSNNFDNRPASQPSSSGSGSVAIRAAISGLDKELARLDREERLLTNNDNDNSDGALT
jgi:hypothetical protein